MKKAVLNRLINHELITEDPHFLLQAFIDANDETNLKPVQKCPYVGIEIECFAASPTKVQELLFNYELEDYVQIGTDDSIEPDHDNEYEAMELRCLVQEKELNEVLIKLGKVLKIAKCKVNESCGLHVHLDMRYRDMEACYAKLVKFQKIMYGLVGEDRWFNDMCEYSGPSNKDSRYTAINRTSYNRHKTIEVRLHHGSVDVKEIGNWIQLLLKAINSKSTKEFENVKTKKDVLTWASQDKKIKSYISKGFNSTAFRHLEEQFDEDGDLF